MRRRRQRKSEREGHKPDDRKKSLVPKKIVVCVPEFYDDTFCFFNDEDRRRKRRALVFTLEGNEIKETCACHLSFQYSCNEKEEAGMVAPTPDGTAVTFFSFYFGPALRTL